MDPDRSKAISTSRGGRVSTRSLNISDETFHALIEKSNDAVVLFDCNWNVAYASASIEKMMGYTRAEVLGASAFDFIFPEDVGHVRALLEDCLANPGKPVRLIARIRHKDESWRILEGIFINFLHDPRVHAIVNNFRDITESMQAEAALRESEEKFKRAFRSNPGAMSITTLADGKFLDVNEALLRLTGFTREELVGHIALETSWVDPDDRRRMIRSLQETGRVESMEVCFRKKSGEIFFANLSAEVVVIGGVKCVLATSQDITDRRRAADEIRRSEEEYRSLVELAPYGICRATYDGTISMVNSALVKMLGYSSAEEMMNLNLGSDIYEDPTERNRILKRAQAGPLPPFESTWKRKDGTTISVRLAARVIYDNQNRLIYSEVFVENVTKQRALERQLLTAQKMEAVGQLAGGIAHDFNNLLLIINSRAALVIEAAKHPEQVIEQSGEIVRATRRAAALTRQLLSFSRDQVLAPVVLDLNALVAELGNMLPHLVGKTVEIRILADPELNRVKVDRGQLEQVIVNLAVNARDVMPPGGRLIIETSNVDFDTNNPTPSPLMKPGRYVLLSVTDTGVGMDEKTLAHVFEPFFTTKERGKGTGLGLSMVYGIVEQSSGHISVASVPGAGTTFRIYLPEAAGSFEESPTEQFVPAPGGTETILYVEDEEAVRTGGADFLRSKGYNVLSAEDGVQALEILRTSDHPIHLLVTDVVMPRMGGAELVKNALAQNPNLRVLYISGHPEGDRPGVGVKSSDVLLQKPVSVADLARKVRAVLDEKLADGRAQAQAGD